MRGLQFCFDGWLFLVDGCGFFFFPHSYNGLDQPPVSAWLRFYFIFFFLQWLVVFVVVGRWLVVILVDVCGYTLVFFFFFSSCKGLWLPW